MKERRVCCCGSSGWTRFIGWLDLTLISIVVFSHVVEMPEYLDFSGPSMLTAILGDLGNVITFLASLLHCVMTIVLLTASYTTKHKPILVWIIFYVVAHIFWLVDTVGGCMIAGNGNTPYSADDIKYQLIGEAIAVPILAFFIWVVNTHRKEMIAAQRPVEPEKDELCPPVVFSSV